MSSLDQSMFEAVLREKPREYLLMLKDRGVEILHNDRKVSLDELTDDECRLIARHITEELERRENVQ